MALKRLSTEEMVERTADLLDEGSDEHAALVAFDMGRAMVPQIQATYDGLIQAQPPDESVIDALTRKLGRLDVTHDDLVRTIHGRFQSEITIAIDGATRTELVHARDAVLPKGLETVQLSYTEQAGEAKLRAARVDDAVRATLRKMTTFDGRTLEDLYDQLQEVATMIGEEDEHRAKLGDAGERVLHAGDARNQWIRTINALAAVIAAAGIDEKPILGRIRETEAEADRDPPVARESSSVGPPVSPPAPVTAAPLVAAPNQAPAPSADPESSE